MKKLWIILAALVGIAGAATAVIVTSKKDTTKQTSNSSMHHQTTLGKKDACSILTKDIAVKVLGADPTKGSETPPASSKDISVSTCSYSSATNGTLEDLHNIRTATLLARAPLTSAGADSNHMVFHPMKDGALEITGYGDMAFWDPEFGQLNVLKEGAWYIVSVGKTAVTEHTVDEAKALASDLGLASSM